MNEQQRRRLEELLRRDNLSEVERHELGDLLLLRERETQQRIATPTPANPAPGGPVPVDSQRSSMIITYCQMAGVPSERTLGFIRDSNITADQVRDTLAAERASATPEPGIARRSAAQIPNGGDHVEKFSRGVVNGLLLRGGITPKVKEDREAGEAFRFWSLEDIARESLGIAGVRSIPRGGRESLLTMALEMPCQTVRLQGNLDLRSGGPVGHSTSDFPTLLANVANKALYLGWEEANVTYPLWCSVASFKDFKPKSIAKLSELPDIPEIVNDTDEVPEIFLGEDGETYALRTFAALLTISRQALLNDDTDAFTRVPMKAAAAARRKVNQLAFVPINRGDSTAVKMSDNVNLFHATHANYGTTGTALAIGTLDAGVAAMQNQTGPKGASLNISPKYLLVPPNLRMTGAQLINSSALPLASMSSGIVNPYQGAFDLVVDAEMKNGTGGSAAAWALAGDKNTNPLVEVGLLNGIDAPLLEEFVNPKFLGKCFRIVVDANAKAVDHRNGYKATGAGG